MPEVGSGADAPSDAEKAEELCPLCSRKKHDTGKYPRSKSERRKALLRDAKDPASGLSNRARQFILRTGGNYVPYGHEVSHEVPLATLPKAERCKLDKSDLGGEPQLRTRRRSEHRARHRTCSAPKHLYGI
jgi:hypothetical protein